MAQRLTPRAEVRDRLLRTRPARVLVVPLRTGGTPRAPAPDRRLQRGLALPLSHGFEDVLPGPRCGCAGHSGAHPASSSVRCREWRAAVLAVAAAEVVAHGAWAHAEGRGDLRLRHPLAGEPAG